MANLIPRAGAPFLDGAGRITREWYAYLNAVPSAEAVAAIRAQLAQIIADQGDGSSETAQLLSTGSIDILGTLESGTVILRLKNDIPAPPATYYYGTDASGVKGWHELSLGTLSDVDLTTPPVAGDALVYDGTAWKPGTVDTAAPFFVPDGETYTVAANKQALFTLPIELDGDASLVIDGALVEVS